MLIFLMASTSKSFGTLASVVGNAISALNYQGFHFRVHPLLLLTAHEGDKTSEDTEALMICFETSLGNVFMNVALRYNKRRMSDHAAVGGVERLVVHLFLHHCNRRI